MRRAGRGKSALVGGTLGWPILMGLGKRQPTHAAPLAQVLISLPLFAYRGTQDVARSLVGSATWSEEDVFPAAPTVPLTWVTEPSVLPWREVITVLLARRGKRGDLGPSSDRL